ncbi:MAG: acetyl-CoA carboxylase biotin carboxyl carrier protein subunit [Acidobacteriota bacterium]
MNIVETEPGVYSVIEDGASYEVRAAGSEITIGGFRFEVTIDDPRRWIRPGGAACTHGPVSIQAPMPGKIVRVLVAAGDEVTAGQGIVVIEAMKMQNELKSPRAGRVTTLRAKENDSVNAGAVLALIE